MQGKSRMQGGEENARVTLLFLSKRKATSDKLHGMNAPATATSPAACHRLERRIAAGLLGLVFVAFEWPVLLHPLSSAWGLPGGDFGQGLWNFWIAAEEIGHGRSPWTTELLFAGRTVSLFYHTLNLFYFLGVAPIYLVTRNEILAFNLSHLAAGALGLTCFYRLARAVGARRAVGVVAAVCFAYSPYYLRRLTTLNIQSIWLIAFYALCLLRLWRKQRIRDAVLTGLCVVAFLLADWHYLIFSALATPFLVAWFAASGPAGGGLFTRRRVARGALALAVALPVLALYVVLAVRHAELAPDPGFDNATRIRCSASPLYYLAPGWAERALMDWIEPWRRPEVFAYRTGREQTLFLGVVALLLMVRRFARPRGLRAHLPALLAALFFFILSLGPALILFAPVTIGADRMIVLPGHYLHQLPVFSSIRHVTRFGLMTLFFLLLAACAPGVGAGRTASRARLTRLPVLALTLGLLVLHFADMRAFIGRRETWRPSAELRAALRADVPQGPVMILPAFEWQSEGLGMYLQTIHGRALVAGYLSRDPEAEIYGTPEHRRFYEMVIALSQGGVRRGDIALPAAETLPAMVILHRRRLGAHAGAVERTLGGVFGYRATHRDSRLIVMVRG